jgi:penicillin G amidase
LVQYVMPEWKGVTSQAVAAWWTHLKFSNNLLQVTYDLNQSRNINDSRKAASELISPGLNIVYGDATGNIAWWAAGRLVKRAKNTDPTLLIDGSNANHDPVGFYEFSENPKSENPPGGIIYSANNQPDTMTGNVLYPGYYVPEDRAKRIGILLRERERYSIEDMQRINTDVVSPISPLIAHEMMDAVTSQMVNKSKQHYAAAQKLLTWNGDHQLRDITPTIYYKFVYNVLEAAMEDELGPANFKVFLSTHTMKNTLLPMMKNDSSIWWNDVRTGDVKESRNMIMDKAFDLTIQQLDKQLGANVDTWEWGRVHFLEHVHPIGMKKPFNLFFNVGPYPVPGGQEVINQIAFDLNGEGIYKAKYGPAMRISLDFSDPENSKSVLPTGQSGNVMSPYYYDQAVMYNTGQTRKQKMNRKAIEEGKTGRLLLEPLKNMP